MATVKDCYTLTSYFERQYKNKYNFSPTLNKYAARWGFDAVLSGMSLDDAKTLIDYYFTTTSPNRHSVDWFFYNYEKLVKARNEHAEDAERRVQLRQESKARAAEWRKRIGNQRTTSN